MNVKRSVEVIKARLGNAKIELDHAEAQAKEIKDPELSKKITEAKSQVLGVWNYVRERTNGKVG